MTRILGPTCPSCGSTDSSVVDSRPNPSGQIRRRRECGNGHRYTTYEATTGNLMDGDPARLRGVAERWSNIACPVRFGALGTIHAPVLVRAVAEAMEDELGEARGPGR